MPWTPEQAKKHNKRAVGLVGKQWAEVANSVLAKTGNEARAIRAANAVISRRNTGLDSVKRKHG